MLQKPNCFLIQKIITFPKLLESWEELDQIWLLLDLIMFEVIMDDRKMAPTIMIMFDDVVSNASSNLPCTMSPVNPVNLAEVFPEIRRQELPTFLHMEFFTILRSFLLR